MKYLILIALIFSFKTMAECPLEIFVSDQAHCVEIKWLEGEIKKRGNYDLSDVLSPVLNENGLVPQEWIYSQAEIKVWLKNDPNKLHAYIPQLTIFPFMYMGHGHSHPISSYQYENNADADNIKMSQMNLQEMPMSSCWTLRWTLANEQKLRSSQHLKIINEYTNINDNETICEGFHLDGHSH